MDVWLFLLAQDVVLTSILLSERKDVYVMNWYYVCWYDQLRESNVIECHWMSFWSDGERGCLISRSCSLGFFCMYWERWYYNQDWIFLPTRKCMQNQIIDWLVKKSAVWGEFHFWNLEMVLKKCIKARESFSSKLPISCNLIGSDCLSHVFWLAEIAHFIWFDWYKLLISWNLIGFHCLFLVIRFGWKKRFKQFKISCFVM